EARGGPCMVRPLKKRRRRTLRSAIQGLRSEGRATVGGERKPRGAVGEQEGEKTCMSPTGLGVGRAEGAHPRRRTNLPIAPSHTRPRGKEDTDEEANVLLLSETSQD